MTQKELVDAVNRLSVGYNVTWWEIQNDADAAVDKINAYLGTDYPSMSKILTSPESIYALKQNGKYTKIFDDMYIRSIVIPYIASEILARDEEFTTIYNKYAMDVENGLFTMFQNEFNRVPDIFKQKDTTGVFFSSDYEEKHPEIHRDKIILNPKYVITYHINKDDIVYTGDSLHDTEEYDYKEAYNLQNVDEQKYFFSTDGIHCYTFDGWYQDAACTIDAMPTDNIVQDIDVYAKWTQHNMYTVCHTTINNIRYTTVTIDNSFINNSSFNGVLTIPTNVGGYKINALTSELIRSISGVASCITKLNVPYYGIEYISAGFFENFTELENIQFYFNPSEVQVKSNTIYDQSNLLYSTTYNSVDNYKVANSGLNWSTPSSLSFENTKITTLVIPNSVKTINKDSFKSSNESADITEVTSIPSDITHKIEVLCDYTTSKPDTFALSDGVYIKSTNNTSRVLYHIKFKNNVEA